MTLCSFWFLKLTLLGSIFIASLETLFMAVILSGPLHWASVMAVILFCPLQWASVLWEVFFWWSLLLSCVSGFLPFEVCHLFFSLVAHWSGSKISPTPVQLPREHSWVLYSRRTRWFLPSSSAYLLTQLVSLFAFWILWAGNSPICDTLWAQGRHSSFYEGPHWSLSPEAWGKRQEPTLTTSLHLRQSG